MGEGVVLLASSGSRPGLLETSDSVKDSPRYKQSFAHGVNVAEIVKSCAKVLRICINKY